MGMAAALIIPELPGFPSRLRVRYGDENTGENFFFHQDR
jgi:hypothetical protein